MLNRVHPSHGRCDTTGSCVVRPADIPESGVFGGGCGSFPVFYPLFHYDQLTFRSL